MKYWVYINDKVDGPYDGEKLVTLDGFTPDTLICSEAEASSGKQAWTKASTIFDFEPTEEEQPASAAVVGGIAANTLLEKLNALTQELSNLQNKLDTMESNMESHINKALEDQRAQLESAFAAKKASTPETPTPAVASTPSTQEQPAKTQQPQEHLSEEYPLGTETEQESNSKSESGEELVIRSALDSLSNAQALEEQEERDEKEDTFQDLLTPAQAKELAKTVETPVTAESEQKKNDLLDELAGPAQDDVLDQIIKEKQEEEKGSISPLAAAAVGAAAGVGIAALKASPEKTSSVGENLDLSSMGTNAVEPLQIAPDKQNPDHLENVLPADQMPADVLPQENNLGDRQSQENMTSLPGVEDFTPPEQSEKEDVVDDNENTLQELVPGAVMEPPEGVLVTEQDLREAFTERIPNGDAGLVAPFSDSEIPTSEEKPSLDFSNQSISTPGQDNGNANELTEIELKEGATYLISDFVPPAQTDQGKNFDRTPAKKVEDTSSGIQDMLSSASAEEEQKNNNNEMDIASALQQTTSKRGASFDIKTVPMVPEPGQSERLHMEGLDDGVNAQHDIKPADAKSSKPVKMIMGLLVGLLLFIILYALLAFMHLLPNSMNFLSKPASTEASVPTAQMKEMLSAKASQTEQKGNGSLEDVLEDVKNYVLPNGYTLQAFIEAKHPTISPDLITWDISEAVEPDNYSVLAKVPPENPQSFKMSYRFNYNTVAKTLDPTISDAKNLLESATNSSTSTGL